MDQRQRVNDTHRPQALWLSGINPLHTQQTLQPYSMHGLVGRHERSHCTPDPPIPSWSSLDRPSSASMLM